MDFCQEWSLHFYYRLFLVMILILTLFDHKKTLTTPLKSVRDKINPAQEKTFRMKLNWMQGYSLEILILKYFISVHPVKHKNLNSIFDFQLDIWWRPQPWGEHRIWPFMGLRILSSEYNSNVFTQVWTRSRLFSKIDRSRLWRT